VTPPDLRPYQRDVIEQFHRCGMSRSQLK